LDRRHFIRQTAVGSVALRGVAATALGTRDDTPPAGTPAVLRRLENRFLAVVVFADGGASIEDKTRGVAWAMGPVALQDKSEIEVGEVWLRGERGIAEQYPGRFAGEAKGDHLRFTLLARQGRPVGRFVCDVSLDEDELVYRVLEIDDTVPSLAFPPPIESDAVVLPSGLGRIVRKAEAGTIFPRHLHTFFTQLNMRWIGGLRGDAGWIAIFDEGFEDAFAILASGSVSPGCLRTLGKWRHPYTIRYAFTGGGHVGLAKTYRRWFQKKGLFVSLDEKLRRNPRLRSFLGGRSFWIDLARPRQRRRTAEELLVPVEKMTSDESLDVHFRYADVKALVGQMKKAGLTRGFLKIAGWIDGGYDWSHPDVWPPPPALGGLEELREILQGDGDLLAGLHDNNQDMYEHTPSFPNGVNRLASGELMTGGIWAGGQAYILRSDASLAYARPRPEGDVRRHRHRHAALPVVRAGAPQHEGRRPAAQARADGVLQGRGRAVRQRGGRRLRHPARGLVREPPPARPGRVDPALAPRLPRRRLLHPLRRRDRRLRVSRVARGHALGLPAALPHHARLEARGRLLRHLPRRPLARGDRSRRDGRPPLPRGRLERRRDAVRKRARDRLQPLSRAANGRRRNCPRPGLSAPVRTP
jgi:hypothetical protein